MKLNDILKTKLQESDWQEEHRRLLLQEMSDWCKDMGIRNFNIQNEGSGGEVIYVSGTSTVTIRVDRLPINEQGKAYLPYKFGETTDFIIIPSKTVMLESLHNCPYMVDGSFNASYLKLKSAVGCPGSVNETCDLSGNEFTNFDGIPSYVSALNLAKNKITSFTGISRHLQNCGELVVDTFVNKDILEIMKIEQLESLEFMNYGNLPKDVDDEVRKVSRIVNECLQGSRDVFDLQGDLLDAGLDSWLKKS